MMIFDYEKAFKIAASKEVDFMILKRANNVNDYNKYYAHGNGLLLSNNEFMILKSAIEE